MGWVRDVLGNWFGGWQEGGQQDCKGCQKQTDHRMRSVRSPEKSASVDHVWKEFECKVDGTRHAQGGHTERR